MAVTMSIYDRPEELPAGPADGEVALVALARLDTIPESNRNGVLQLYVAISGVWRPL
jgi:hypothetical protein